MLIREALKNDLETVLAVERAAFGSEEVPDLVKGLASDPTAEPIVSLLAFKDELPVGHIMFTKAHLTPDNSLSVYILAPLAVIPEFQRQGIGEQLIKAGLKILSDRGTDLVFVLGHPEYYPKHGFKPAAILGFQAPYPIPEKDANAWMVQELRTGVPGDCSGTIMCALAMDKPEHWRE